MKTENKVRALYYIFVYFTVAGLVKSQVFKFFKVLMYAQSHAVHWTQELEGLHED